MSGHSKWSQIKRKKGVTDQARGRVFSKLAKEITVAAKEGGGSIEGNARLRAIVEEARGENMPQDNIKRAIQKGTGELPGVSYEAITYEGYGPGGVAVLVETLTDNKKRSAAEMRNIFSKHGGNMAEAGAVGWLFHRKGIFSIDQKMVGEEELIALALDAGAEDVKSDESTYEVVAPPTEFEKVKKALAEKKISCLSADLTMVPSTSVRLEGRPAEQCMELMEALEEHDDVQNVFANFDIPDTVLASSQP